MKRERVKLHSLGKKIKELRKNKIKEYHGTHSDLEFKGITQADLAKTFNVSIDTVKNWEQGYNYPPVDTLVELADYFHCDFDYLLGNQEQPRKVCGHVSKHTGLSEKAAAKLVSMKENGDPVISVLSDLIENETLLQQLAGCITNDYGKVSAFKISDPFNPNGIVKSVFVTPERLYDVDKMNLYSDLIKFINCEREKTGSPHK